MRAAADADGAMPRDAAMADAEDRRSTPATQQLQVSVAMSFELQ